MARKGARSEPAKIIIPPRERRVTDNPRSTKENTVIQNFRVVVRAIQAHSTWVEKQCGLPAAQLWALWEIFKEPGLKVSELSEHLAIKASTASNLLDRLEDRGLVMRDRRGPDHRVVRLYVTDAGLRLLHTAPRPAEGALTDALARLSDHQLGELNRSLGRLVAAFRTKELDSGTELFSAGLGPAPAGVSPTASIERTSKPSNPPTRKRSGKTKQKE